VIAAAEPRRARYTFLAFPGYRERVGSSPTRLNVTLDPERTAKLALLAQRTQTQAGTLAGWLLSKAIDEADLGARHVVELLDGIPCAFERAQLGLEQARAGKTIAADEL
jgi:hypothetical protein